MGIFFLLIALFPSFCDQSILGYYQLGYSYSQNLYDYSGSGYNGQNGCSTSLDDCDTNSTNRGAYFHKNNQYIMLPPNDLSNYSMLSFYTFSLFMWIYPFKGNQDYNLLYIGSYNDVYVFFNWIHSSNSSLIWIIFEDVYYGQLSKSNSMIPGIMYLDIWQMISIKFDQGTVNCFINQESTQKFNYGYSDRIYISNKFLIGFNSNSLIGFVWNLYLFNKAVDPNIFYSNNYKETYCIGPKCSKLCNYALKTQNINLETYNSCDYCSVECDSSSCPNILCVCPQGTLSTNCACLDGFYLDQFSCNSCYPECLTCNQSFLCNSCKQNNSEPHSTIGCVCKKGFYNSSSLLNNGTCEKCLPGCSLCSSTNKCIKCISENANINENIGCECKEGYYSISSVESSLCQPCNDTCNICEDGESCLKCKYNNSVSVYNLKCSCKEGFYRPNDVSKVQKCKDCHIDCKKCNNSSSCESCIDSNAVPSSNYCSCNPGFYNSSVTSALNCSKCSENCSLCENLLKCTDCLYYKMTPSNGLCKCSPNSSLKNGSCVPDKGYFLSNDSALGFIAKKCYENCEICTGEDSLNCTTCVPGMFFDSLACKNCSNNCLLCENSSYCLNCSNKSILYNGVCYPSCPLFQYFTKGACQECPDLCTECNPNCSNCTENALLTQNNECTCIEGYEKSSKSCKKKFFSALLSIKSISLAILNFTEPVKTSLTQSDFIISVGNRTDFNSTLLKSKSKLEYLFKLNFEKEVKKGTQIKLKIIPQAVLSLNNSQLKNYEFNDELPHYLPAHSNPFNKTMHSIVSSSRVTAQTAVSSSIGASLVSNPAAAWALLNSIQMLIFLPLSSNQMTPNVKIFLAGFGGYNILPNPIGARFDDKATSSPFLEARRYGIETSVFFINTGKFLLVFIVVLILWPFFYLLSKFNRGKITVKAIKLLANYKYGFFLRFWAQSVLEILIFSIVQLKSVSAIQTILIPDQGYFNLLLATILAVSSN